MKLPQINNSIHQNRVHYIGHGQLESSSEALSALHVISHELGHVAEFKSEAKKIGMDIADIKVHIHYELRDGKLVAVAGETEAVYLPQKKDNPKTEIYIDISSFLLSDIPKKEKLEKELLILENEIKTLEKELAIKVNDHSTNLELKQQNKIETLNQNKIKLKNEIDLIQNISDLKETGILILDKIFGSENRGTKLDKLA